MAVTERVDLAAADDIPTAVMSSDDAGLGHGSSGSSAGDTAAVTGRFDLAAAKDEPSAAPGIMPSAAVLADVAPKGVAQKACADLEVSQPISKHKYIYTRLAKVRSLSKTSCSFSPQRCSRLRVPARSAPRTPCNNHVPTLRRALRPPHSP